jgi:hypothetical protein
VYLPLAGLAAGEYLLELSATAESGTVTHLVAMHVSN